MQGMLPQVGKGGAEMKAVMVPDPLEWALDWMKWPGKEGRGGGKGGGGRSEQG